MGLLYWVIEHFHMVVACVYTGHWEPYAFWDLPDFADWFVDHPKLQPGAWVLQGSTDLDFFLDWLRRSR